MKRKIISLVLIIVILFGSLFVLTGCGNNESSGKEDTNVDGTPSISGEETIQNLYEYLDDDQYDKAIDLFDLETMDKVINDMIDWGSDISLSENKEQLKESIAEAGKKNKLFPNPKLDITKINNDSEFEEVYNSIQEIDLKKYTDYNSYSEIEEKYNKYLNNFDIYVVTLDCGYESKLYDIYIVKDGKIVDSSIWKFALITYLPSSEKSSSKSSDSTISNRDDSIIQMLKSKKIKVGDIINYDAKNSKVEPYTTEESVTGNTKSATFSSDDEITWRVLGYDESTGKVELFGITSKYVYLSGKNGYKNAVKVLNDASAVYGKGNGATEARSVSIDDLEKYLEFDRTAYSNYKGSNSYTIKYGESKTYTSGTFINDDGSEVVVPDNQPSIEVKSTYTTSYGQTFKETKERDVMMGENITNSYWLATPNVYISDSGVDYSIAWLNRITIEHAYMTTEKNKNGAGEGLPVGVIVTLDGNTLISGGDGSSGWNIK